MPTKRELEIRLAATAEEFYRYDERLSHLAERERKLAAVLDTLNVTQQDLIWWKHRAEAAERRVAELEVQLATMTILAIDGIGYYVLPGPGVSTSPSSPPPADSA